MKKLRILTAFITILCTAAMPVQALPCSVPAITANAETETIEYNGMTFETREDRTDELLLVSYDGTEENLTIPETVDGMTVTGITENAFRENQIIKNVILPDIIDYFESNIFADSSIETVNIPQSLYIIPNCTFQNCTNLKSVELHDYIIGIAKTAFENASFQPSWNSNEYAENSYGYYNFSVSADENGNDFAIIQRAVLRENQALNMIFPKEINGLPVKKFYDTNFLRSYEVIGKSYPKSICYLNTKILDYYADVNSIDFPEYLNNINTTVFQDHEELNKLTIRADNVQITDNAFENTGVERLEIHNPKQIGKNSFAGCTELKSITFDECSGDLLIDKNAFSGCENLQTLTIEGNPETLTINDYAFKNCTSLEKIMIPKTCKNLVIGRSALKDTQIKEIEIDSDCTIEIDAFAGCLLESVIINSENAEIKLGAFDNCKNLKELKLSKGCNLSANSFMNCTALENINIDISESITGSAFNGCTNLTSINCEQVFDEKTGDFVPKYKDFIMENFNLADDIGFINQYVQANVKKIVAENITPDMNDMQKVRTLHDWVCNHTSYSPSGQESHNDAAILMNDTTVCEGYSRLCNLLYHEAGLETYYVTGVNHAWNIVNIDGRYFHVDSTWDDSNDEINYKWFCKSDSEMKNAGGYHASWKVAVISSLHDFQENISPECNYQMGDMNTDGNVNIADAVKLEKYILNSEKPDSNLILSDLNFDGITDVFDMIEMRNKIKE